MIPIFVISLPQATQKQELVKKHMQNLGIPFEFVYGVDGRLLSEEELQKVFDRKKSYNYYKWYRNRKGIAGVELSRGEIGCTLAHRKVYQKIVDENIKLAVVLEDDVLVTKDFLPVIEKALASIERSYAGKIIIKLDVTLQTSLGGYGKIGMIVKDTLARFMRPIQIRIDKELAIVKSPMNFGGAQGYIIDNNAARAMLGVNNPVFVISDEWNYHARFVTVRALNKAIAPCKIEGSDIWIKKWPEHIPIPFKYRYAGFLKKLFLKIYLFLWR
jgi:glycosyl transferase family 25